MRLAKRKETFSVHETTADLSFSTLGIFLIMTMALIVIVAKSSRIKDETLRLQQEIAAKAQEVVKLQAKVIETEGLEEALEKARKAAKDKEKIEKELKKFREVTAGNPEQLLDELSQLKQEREENRQELERLKRVKPVASNTEGLSGFMVEFALGASSTLREKPEPEGYYSYDLVIIGPDEIAVGDNHRDQSPYLERARLQQGGPLGTEYVLQVPTSTGVSVRAGIYHVEERYRSSGTCTMHYIVATKVNGNVKILYNTKLRLPPHDGYRPEKIFSFEIDSRGTIKWSKAYF